MKSVTAEAQYVLQFINQTNCSVFLTGKAGTGKTTLLKEIIQTTHKNTVVVAPTGIAALNAGGVTIHSMFQLPFGGFLPDNSSPQFNDSSKFESRLTLRRHFKMSGLKKAVIRNMELLIIDEVSMLRADLLDALDFMMQTVRKNNQVFGGVQVLFIGDLLQLPPVIREDEWRTLSRYYKGKFFFHAHVIEKNPPIYIELSKIFRQTDDAFISVLNNLRVNKITANDIQVLNQFVQPKFDLKANKGYITLTTHNHKADTINAQSLADLEGEIFRYRADVIGDFPDKIFPLEEKLELKVGAQIMFIKNDSTPEKKFFNGKMGIIQTLSEREIWVHFPEENTTIEVEKYVWENIRYTVNENSKEIEEEILGTFTHYPIKLAWAITVHKSQGLTFDKAALDVADVFLPGQAYVALSRLRSLNGLVLLSPLQMNGISSDQEVMNYALNKAESVTLENTLHQETKNFIRQYLMAAFDWSALLQEWRNHLYSYNEKTDLSIKTQHKDWAIKQWETLQQLTDPAHKFIAQLNKLFSEEVDFHFVKNRIFSAYDYFFPILDQLTHDILWQLEEVIRMKKAKAYFEELLVLEELQTKTVIRLMKAKQLIATVANGETISKENLSSEAIKTYRFTKAETVRQAYKNTHLSLIDEEEPSRYTKKKKQKEPKKSTVQETYELWLQQYTIKEIAAARKLTAQTISSHLAKLIETETIAISAILPEDKIAALAQAFKNHKEESLGSLKEKYGDEFTWDELKMYQAARKSGLT
ncbi:helix-turn-helix domain-containing protein [Flavobacterium sp.]|jgi:hypothetical protein|uniref:helix-turn-helix domain-containing protein n=1 Tax=Flavobacterium sp. TaxID=239 RepID=UPI00378351C2